MTPFVKDFCHQVLWRVAHGRRAIIVADAILGEVVVCGLHVSLHVEENALGFEVVVDDVQMVKVFDRLQDFGSVGSATVLTETTHTVQLARGLKRIMDLHSERVPDSL